MFRYVLPKKLPQNTLIPKQVFRIVVSTVTRRVIFEMK